jgi:hypothetical protein
MSLLQIYLFGVQAFKFLLITLSVLLAGQPWAFLAVCFAGNAILAVCETPPWPSPENSASKAPIESWGRGLRGKRLLVLCRTPSAAPPVRFVIRLPYNSPPLAIVARASPLALLQVYTASHRSLFGCPACVVAWVVTVRTAAFAFAAWAAVVAAVLYAGQVRTRIKIMMAVMIRRGARGGWR